MKPLEDKFKYCNADKFPISFAILPVNQISEILRSLSAWECNWLSIKKMLMILLISVSTKAYVTTNGIFYIKGWVVLNNTMKENVKKLLCE